jgi:ribonucleoside-diphosphate reductase alpha chain
MDNRPHLTENAQQLLYSRYLRKNNKSEVIETPRQMFERVAKCVSYPELAHGGADAHDGFYNVILDAMLDLAIMPASPYLFNARDPREERPGGLFSCFVLPLEDSIDGIYKCIGECAKIYQAAGGIGVDFSVLRERKAIVETSKGVASGPLSFLNIFHHSACEMTHGGVRRAASIAFMDVDHPDIEDFITIKSRNLPEINRLMRIILTSADKMLKKYAKLEVERLQHLTSFNLSVKMTDVFMKAVEENADWDLVSRKTGKVLKTLKARRLFNMICEYAWKSGDPGVCFIDNVNANNPLPGLGPIQASNPCGELYMHPYHACNLVAISLSKCVIDGGLDIGRLRHYAHLATRMAENAIDVSSYALPQIEKSVKATRGVGIGVMGLADALIKLGVPYDSDGARKFAQEALRHIKEAAIEQSKILYKERGLPDNWKKSTWAKQNIKIRNLWHTTCQPTGSVSIIAGDSQSIEPLFNVYFKRATNDGKILVELNYLFRQALESHGINIDETIAAIERAGSIQKIDFIPDDIKNIFKCAHDISPEAHILMQAAVQEFVDSGISKTINMPPTVTHADIAKAYKLAHGLGCKGTTIFREGSKAGVLNVVSAEDKYHEELRRWLRTKFTREGLSAREISELLGVSEQLIFAKLKRYGIRKEEHETALRASQQKLDQSLREIILANILVGHSRLTTVAHQSSYRQVTDHIQYAHSVRKQFLDRGIQCGEIMTIVTDKTYYYFDTCFMQDIYDLPIDFDSVIEIKNKKEIREFITPHFMRHLFLVGGVKTGKGGIKFTSNSRNAEVLAKVMGVFGEVTDTELNVYEDSAYVPKNSVEDLYNFLESGADVSVELAMPMVCPECGSTLVSNEKCNTCPSCGWGACAI